LFDAAKIGKELQSTKRKNKNWHLFLFFILKKILHSSFFILHFFVPLHP